MLNSSDNELIFYALNQWANWIETDNISLSATDAKNSDHHYNALTAEQMKLVIRLRDLAQEILI